MGNLRHRRNHAVAGLALVLAGALTWLATTQSLVRIDGPAFTAGSAKKLGLEIKTGLDYGMDPEIQLTLYAAALGFVVMGLLLLITRVRYLGLLWRVGALCSLGITGAVVVAAWMFVSDPASAISDADADTQRLFRGGLSVAKGLGLLDVSAAGALYLLTAASIVALLGVLTPAFRRTEAVAGADPSYGS
jgi:hypothetical protein